MTANISPVGNSQFIDVNGNPLSGGKLYTYEAGTTTPLAAYTTAEGDVPQPNPVILNSLGTLDDPLYLANGVAYKIIVKTSAGVSLGLEYDDIYGVAAADTTADEWLEFTGTFTYVSSTSFTVSGDQTSIFQVSRKLKTQNTAGIAYSNIASATYSAPDTTVTVTNTFLTLDSGISQIWYGFLEPTHSSIPETTIGTAVRVGTQVEAQSALGVYSESEVDSLIAGIQTMPAGAISAFAMNTAPTGWLKANGAAVSRTTYATLFAALISSATVTMTIASPGVVTWTSHGRSANDPIKFSTTGALPTGFVAGTTYYVVGASITTDTFRLSATAGGTAINTTGTQSGVHTGIHAPHGTGDGSTTFNIPDLRGEFARGWDDGRAIDTNRAIGSAQADELKAHTHIEKHTGTGGATNQLGYGGGSLGSTDSAISTGSTGGTETRPRNIALLMCVKY